MYIESKYYKFKLLDYVWSRKILRKGKKIMWKIIFFSLDNIENMMKKKLRKIS